MALSLPVELLDNVASFTKKADLLSLALTCKSFHNAAIPYIWQDISITIGDAPKEEDTYVLPLMLWSVGGSKTPSDDRLRHVRQFEIIDDCSTSVPLFLKALIHMFITLYLNKMQRLEGFTFFPETDLMILMPYLIDSLREMHSLSRLSILFPVTEDLWTVLPHMATERHLKELKNLKILKFGFGYDSYIFAAAVTMTSILLNSPNLRVLCVGSNMFETEIEKTAPNWGFLSMVCNHYSKKQEQLRASTESTGLAGDGELCRRPWSKHLLPLEHITLVNACLLGPEIHLLADTSFLKRLDVSNLEFEGRYWYRARESALKVLAGRAPNLVSVSFAGGLRTGPDAEGIDFGLDFPSLSELSVWDSSNAAGFMETMNACGGAGIKAQRWKKLLLAKPCHHSSFHESTFTPLLSFVTDCTHLTHLAIHIRSNLWEELLDTLRQLTHLREVYVLVMKTTDDDSPYDAANAARELFDCNHGIGIVTAGRFYDVETQFWRRGQDTPYPLYEGKTRMLDFPPERHTSHGHGLSVAPTPRLIQYASNDHSKSRGYFVGVHPVQFGDLQHVLPQSIEPHSFQPLGDLLARWPSPRFGPLRYQTANTFTRIKPDLHRKYRSILLPLSDTCTTGKLLILTSLQIVFRGRFSSPRTACASSLETIALDRLHCRLLSQDPLTCSLPLEMEF